jgi:hypothetical protein
MISAYIFLLESAVEFNFLVLRLMVFEPAWVESFGPGAAFISIYIHTYTYICIYNQAFYYVVYNNINALSC